MTERQSEAIATSLERSLPRRAYVEPAYFERERRNIFWSQWFCIGRISRFDEAGSYETMDVAGESVIVIRSSDSITPPSSSLRMSITTDVVRAGHRLDHVAPRGLLWGLRRAIALAAGRVRVASTD